MMIKALFLACFLVIAFAGTCGGNCPSGSCPSCTCGYDKQILDLSAWCAAYNWDQYCCKCIFSRLSGGNANFMAHTSGTYPWTVGIFAINQFYWSSCSSGKAPCDPNQNLKCAIKAYNWAGKTSWAMWPQSRSCGCK